MDNSIQVFIHELGIEIRKINKYVQKNYGGISDKILNSTHFYNHLKAS